MKRTKFMNFFCCFLRWWRKHERRERANECVSARLWSETQYTTIACELSVSLRRINQKKCTHTRAQGARDRFLWACVRRISRVRVAREFSSAMQIVPIRRKWIWIGKFERPLPDRCAVIHWPPLKPKWIAWTVQIDRTADGQPRRWYHNSGVWMER